MKPISAHTLARQAAEPYLEEAKQETVSGETDWQWLTMLTWRSTYLTTLRTIEAERRPPPSLWSKHHLKVYALLGLMLWLCLAAFTVFAASHG